MRQDKTPLEQAWLNVLEGEVQVMAQAIRIGELVSLRQETTEAAAVFCVLEGKLRILYEALDLVQAQAVRRQT